MNLTVLVLFRICFIFFWWLMTKRAIYSVFVVSFMHNILIQNRKIQPNNQTSKTKQHRTCKKFQFNSIVRIDDLVRLIYRNKPQLFQLTGKLWRWKNKTISRFIAINNEYKSIYSAFVWTHTNWANEVNIITISRHTRKHTHAHTHTHYDFICIFSLGRFELNAVHESWLLKILSWDCTIGLCVKASKWWKVVSFHFDCFTRVLESICREIKFEIDEWFSIACQLNAFFFTVISIGNSIGPKWSTTNHSIVEAKRTKKFIVWARAHTLAQFKPVINTWYYMMMEAIEKNAKQKITIAY